MLPDLSLDDLVVAVHRRVVDEGIDPTTDRLRTLAVIDELAPFLSASDRATAVRSVRHRTTGLGPLEPLLADPSVTEIMVNGPGEVWVDTGHRLDPAGIRVDADAVRLLVERLVTPSGRPLDQRHPMVDIRLPDGSRANLVLPPIAVDGPCITIRRFADTAVPLASFGPHEVIDLLAERIRSRANVVVSGGTGSGKTTLLNALAAMLPAGCRVVTIEDAAELRLPGDHVVRLETRPPSAELSPVTTRLLVRNALRMRPDRIIVGEVRGNECLDMLWAMNTGHEGSMSTCHANGPDDALHRLAMMALGGEEPLSLPAARHQVHEAIDLVVHLTRHDDGHRSVTEVVEPAPGTSPDAPSRRLVECGRLVNAPERRVR